MDAGGAYGYLGDWYSSGALRPLKMERVQDPYGLGLLADVIYEYRAPFLFHEQFWNVLFVDGHVQSVKETDGDLELQMGSAPPVNGAINTLAAFRIIEYYASGYASIEY